MQNDREERIRAALDRELQKLSAAGEPLDLVEDIPIVEAFVDDFTDARIAAARTSGASWAEIALRLGVSKQAVHKRFTAKRRRRGGASVVVVGLRLNRHKE